ncbi:MAG: Trans-aconitate 2-methyltransferase [Acidimicrobiales bacterium]|nr:Trans-aconitate 2-methyltransferase [Acidimicrobiales bacterium]
MDPTLDQWTPARYDLFRSERERPAHDLYALVTPTPGGTAVDLGCGTGALTVELAERTGAARVAGIDSSAAMLAEAAQRARPGITFEAGDLATWGDPGSPVDVVAANASLHWVPDHAGVLARWTAALVDGGQLAVQVPANADHASHLVAVEVAAEPRFAEAFATVGGPPPDPVAENVLPPEAYAELLWDLGYAEQSVRLQVYGPVLESTAGVVEWMAGTGLTRFERVLEAETYDAFVDRYRQRLLEVVGDRRPYYFSFKRILLWGRRPG